MLRKRHHFGYRKRRFGAGLSDILGKLPIVGSLLGPLSGAIGSLFGKKSEPQKQTQQQPQFTGQYSQYLSHPIAQMARQYIPQKYTDIIDQVGQVASDVGYRKRRRRQGGGVRVTMQQLKNILGKKKNTTKGKRKTKK